MNATASPTAYAQHLATYISSPSTIRVRVLEMFSTAPSFERCEAMRERAVAISNTAPKLRRTKLRCGHGIDQLEGMADGNERCRTCEDVKIAARAEKREQSAQRIAEKAFAEKTARLDAAAKSNADALAIITANTPVARVGGFRVARAADIFGIELEQLTGIARSQHLVDARATVAVAMRHAGLSYLQIGRWLGGRDHSTAMHLCRTFAKRAELRPYLNDALAALL